MQSNDDKRQHLTVVPNMMPTAGGGLSFLPRSFGEVRLLAQDLANSGPGVRKEFRNNVSLCVVVVMDALHWGMLPTQTIRKAYVVADCVCYEAQLVHAVINTRAGLVDDLEESFEGEGRDMKCTVVGTLDRGKRKPREYESPMIKNIKVQNSPLWQSDPKQQLHYFSVRNWARKWCPEVILGVYTKDEIESGEITAEDRAAAIEHKAAMIDVLDDESEIDPNAPPPSAPLVHRYSYALEQCRNEAEIMAVQYKFQPEIEAADETAKPPLRELLKAHLRRVRAELPYNEVMEFSAAFRAKESSDDNTDSAKRVSSDAESNVESRPD